MSCFLLDVYMKNRGDKPMFQAHWVQIKVIDQFLSKFCCAIRRALCQWLPQLSQGHCQGPSFSLPLFPLTLLSPSSCPFPFLPFPYVPRTRSSLGKKVGKDNSPCHRGTPGPAPSPLGSVIATTICQTGLLAKPWMKALFSFFLILKQAAKGSLNDYSSRGSFS